MRASLSLALLGALWLPGAAAQAPTADDLTKLIERLIELDSIELIDRGVKFRPGLEPSLHAVDADESEMKVLKDPRQAHGQGKPGAAGWYRLSFVVPEKLGKFAIPKGGYNLGVETNLQGSWEIYSYVNGKPTGNYGTGLLTATNRRPTDWVSNAPMPTRAGDKVTIAILALAAPLGKGSPEGYALRHLRLRFALAHTAARQPFFGAVTAPGTGTGLLGARERLRALKGEDLQALQEKLRGPLARMDAVFEAAETAVLGNLSKAMTQASKEIAEALKK